MGLDPAVAAVRSAVRGVLPGPGEVALVACSGGADSLALLAATVFEARRDAVRVVGAVVDHGLQAGSAEHTARVVEQMAGLGVDETATIRVTVDPGPGGIEAGAREARYAALGQLAEHVGAGTVLLGHTLDDQAETVLLGLARGSGGRSLQGMRRSFDLDGVRAVRPLLGLTRQQTEAACTAEGITWWDDPQNEDRAFTRSRIRHTVMPVLERELGPGVAQALARTADQLRTDMGDLEERALGALDEARIEGGIDPGDLECTSPAVFGRVLRMAAVEAGAIASELTFEHVQAIRSARPGKEIRLPGHVTAYREGEWRILFKPTPSLSDE
ncbi:tRNA lysidine(34) synthetase TilS [Nocardioides marmorisolisilvae]|uniref:tRNA(Ile)-lysidine synthase n=1 Tax=Nocardioides marmorisolisilvae TaxID=1542737 RepID=A0A3N0E070_9ACTN|nr:tRNA lysidine(34) synthetase TilS [Nocardioides marmorisolisilvae]RNL81241.1 tRNA lysidine(34) synthetase TilS [Nocardioides marmorisolisilvae]